MMTFVTGARIAEIMADLKTFHPVRKKPARPVETYSGKLLQASDYVDQPIHTEDYAAILMHYENGVRGNLTVSQVSAGRKNRLSFEIDGAAQSLAWDSEHPNDLWIGRRDAPNGLLMKDPALLSPAARDVNSYPGGHQEGFPDTFQLAAAVYGYIRAGNMDAQPDFPTFADGHYEMQLCEAVERSAAEGTWAQVEA
jgi:predicted dehydrogenase